MVSTLSDFISFWFGLAIAGILQGITYFSSLDGFLIVLVAGLYWIPDKWIPEKHRTTWRQWEVAVRKIAAAIIAITVMFSLFVIAPFVEHRKDQETIQRLMQATNAFALDLEMAREQLRSTTKNTGYELAESGTRSFQGGAYELACAFYDRAFSFNDPSHEFLVKYGPLHVFSILMTNQTAVAGTSRRFPPVAIGKFENVLNDMTNRMGQAVIGHFIGDSYNSSNKMSLNLENLSNIQVRFDPINEAKLSNFVGGIIATVKELQKKSGP